VPRIALSGLPFRERNGNGHRKERRELRQPPLLPLDLLDGPLDPGKPYDHLVAQPVERVVRSRGRDRLDRKIGPLRELRREQAAHERSVGLDLVDVHLHVDGSSRPVG